jgi:mono/diheme cytochrome c family protein
MALLIPVFLVAAWSCNETEAHEPVFGADLPATNFSVNPAKDTVLKTPGGALINIPAGSLEAGDATTVSLEVKEAYSTDEMNRGGLHHGGSDTLASAGMIYVNVTGGQSVNIHKPLGISLPAKSAGGEMMVYKAAAGEDALLRWGDARPLTSAPSHPSTDAGKTLFENRCASCHGGKEELAGPALAWITKRRDRQWLYSFTRNNAILLWRGDGYSCYLFNRYKNPMPLFKDLSDTDLVNLYRYIDNASRSVDSNAVVDHKRGFDSCVANDPNCGTAARRAARTDSIAATPAEAPVADYYTFSIDKHGWYSVAGKAGSEALVAGAFPAVSADALHPTAEPLQGCPCWCNESAYRRADSLGRAKH